MVGDPLRRFHTSEEIVSEDVRKYEKFRKEDISKLLNSFAKNTTNLHDNCAEREKMLKFLNEKNKKSVARFNVDAAEHEPLEVDISTILMSRCKKLVPA